MFWSEVRLLVDHNFANIEVTSGSFPGSVVVGILQAGSSLDHQSGLLF
jgi:hypothetical protein